MDEKRLNNLPYVRQLQKRINVGRKILELAKKHHKDILMYGRPKYVAPNKKIVEHMIGIIPLEDYDAYLESGTKRPFFQVVLDDVDEYLDVKNSGILMIGYEAILDIQKFTVINKDMTTEEEYREFIGGSRTVSDYFKQLDMLGKLWTLGNNIIKLMKKEYPKDYASFSGAGLFDISDFERYAKAIMNTKKKGTGRKYTFAEARALYPKYIQRNIKKMISPKDYFFNYITITVKKSLFGQRTRLV
jgi:hypothetical protein